MVSQAQANYSLNISVHLLILFTFLTIFFFAYISKLSKKSIQDAMDGLINQQVGKLLTGIDNWDKKLNSDYPTIKWKEVNKLAKQVIDKSQGEMPEITDNNTKLQFIGMTMIGSLVVLTIGMFVYFRYIKGYDIHIGQIIAENFVVFLFVGVIEFAFFMYIASKYIPVTPDFVATSALDRVKTNLNSYVKKNA
jgi:hypothetical protein